MITLRIESESWPYKVPFRVSRGAEAALPVIVVTLTDSEGRVGRGEAFGFLGPNGAGKTTAVKLLLGLAFPTSGERCAPPSNPRWMPIWSRNFRRAARAMRSTAPGGI